MMLQPSVTCCQHILPTHREPSYSTQTSTYCSALNTPMVPSFSPYWCCLIPCQAFIVTLLHNCFPHPTWAPMPYSRTPTYHRCLSHTPWSLTHKTGHSPTQMFPSPCFGSEISLQIHHCSPTYWMAILLTLFQLRQSPLGHHSCPSLFSHDRHLPWSP